MREHNDLRRCGVACGGGVFVDWGGEVGGRFVGSRFVGGFVGNRRCGGWRTRRSGRIFPGVIGAVGLRHIAGAEPDTAMLADASNNTRQCVKSAELILINLPRYEDL
jgi:hypothetical protein